MIPTTDLRPPVHVLTGFLGSGKTTLLSRVLCDRAFFNTAVIVNELGEVGLDHLLVTERTENTVLLDGGCLCCAVAESLPETLLELCSSRAGSDAPPFDRILIETTGLADPAPIVSMLRRSDLLKHFLASGRVVTAVDGLSAAGQLKRFAEARAQAVMADRFVITKLDLNPDEEAPLRGRLAAINPLAEILTAQDVALDPHQLLGSDGLALDPVFAPGVAAHTHSVTALNVRIDGLVTQSGLAAWTAVVSERFAERLLRCKGVLRLRTGPLLVQGVGVRFDCTPLEARNADDFPSGLTFIGQDLRRKEIIETLCWLNAPEGTHPPGLDELAERAP